MLRAGRHIFRYPRLMKDVSARRPLVQLAGRPYLPGSDGANFPVYLSPFRDNYPFVINAKDKSKNIEAMGITLRPRLDQLIEEHAAVLIRGLPLQSSEDFSKFFTSLNLKGMEYIGGAAVRTRTAKMVFTASDDDAGVTMEPHNEMSYLEDFPHLIFFYCQVAPLPGYGGESTITDVRKVLHDLDPDVVQRFNRLGVNYNRRLFDRDTMAPGEAYGTWQEGLMAETKEEAEANIRSRCDGFRWEENGTLFYWSRIPAMRPHYRTGEMLWFNQIHSLHPSFFHHHPKFKNIDEKKYPFETSYGDGSPIEDDVIQQIRDVAWKHTVGGQLQKSDVLVLDNMISQHARISFTSPRVLNVALAKY